MPNFSIGVDLGGTNLRIAAVNQQGSLMEKVTLGTRVGLGKDHVIHQMCDAIRLLAARYRDGGALQGIGIGVPGIIDMKTGMLRESPNLPGWAESPVQAQIEGLLGTRVILENDANVAALGEKWLGAAREVDGEVRRVPVAQRLQRVEVLRLLRVRPPGLQRVAVEERAAVERREQPLVRVHDERVRPLHAGEERDRKSVV